MSEVNNFPPQTLPFRRKTKKWRKQCMDWADSKTFVKSLECKSCLYPRQSSTLSYYKQ